MCSRLGLPLLSGELAICPGLLPDGGVLPICLGRGCGRPGGKCIYQCEFHGSSACSGARAQDTRAGRARTAPVDVLKVLHPGPQLGLQRGRRHPRAGVVPFVDPWRETQLLEKMNLSRGRADLEDGLEGLREDGADALEAG